MKFLIKAFFSMITEEILNGKKHFLCSVTLVCRYRKLIIFTGNTAATMSMLCQNIEKKKSFDCCLSLILQFALEIFQKIQKTQ